MNRLSGIAGGLLAGVALAAVSAALAQPAQPADVAIVGGQVYSGADEAAITGDVVIVGDKVVAVGPGVARAYAAKSMIDAKGKIVSPGFIDGHSHPEAGLDSADPAKRVLMPWVTQGTAIVLMGIEATGTPNLADQTARYAKAGIGPNVVPFVGYNVLRGPDGVVGMDDRKPTPAEMAKGEALVKKGMCEGAWGLSINLFSAPNSYSTTEEIIPLARVAGELGGVFHSHQRDESSYTIGLMGSTLENIRIGREAKIPVQITHIKAIGPDVWGQAPQVIDAINKARAEGIDVTADQYPWLAAASAVQKMLIPRWVEDGGRAEMLKRFADPAQLDKVRADIRENLRKRGGADTLLLISADEEWTGKTIEEMGKIWNVPPEDAAIRIVAWRGMNVKQGLTPGDFNGGGLASFSLKDSDVDLFMQQPWMTTSSDAGSNHPRTYATYPEKFHKYAIERKVISVQRFIRSATGLEADFLKLDRRGYLRPGYFADVVVFDPGRFKAKADYVNHSVPSEGVDALFINGVLTVKDSKVTGARAGRTLLHVPPAGKCP